MPRRFPLTPLVFVSVAALGACANAPPPSVPRAGDAAQGYADGCSSGRKGQGSISDEYRRDMGRYRGSPEYARAWNAGYAQCAGQEDQLNAVGGAR